MQNRRSKLSWFPDMSFEGISHSSSPGLHYFPGPQPTTVTLANGVVRVHPLHENLIHSCWNMLTLPDGDPSRGIDIDNPALTCTRTSVREGQDIVRRVSSLS